MSLPEAYAPLRYAAGQISHDQWPALKQAGLAAVINLRPDNEQPGVDEAALVRAAGLTYHALPIASGDDLDRVRVAHFAELLQTHAGQPLLIHCASANRVGALVALHAAWHQGVAAEEAITLGRRAGLAGLEPCVRELLASA